MPLIQLLSYLSKTLFPAQLLQLSGHQRRAHATLAPNVTPTHLHSLHRSVGNEGSFVFLPLTQDCIMKPSLLTQPSV